MKPNPTARVTLWVTRLLFPVLAGFIIALPKLMDWYAYFRNLTPTTRRVIMVAFYLCSVAAALALWNLEGLLRRILSGQVFTRENVRRIRLIRWCCFAVSLICVPAAFFYLPLIFVVIIMAFLALTVSVLSSVMDAAVAIREENDLTV